MGEYGGAVAPAGRLGLHVVRGVRGWDGVGAPPAVPDVPRSTFSFRDVVRHGMPARGLPDEVNDWRTANASNLWRRFRKVEAARRFHIPTVFGALWLQVVRGDGPVVDLGLVSLGVVTDTGVGYIVDAFQNSVELENMKFHGYGTGTTNEAASDTALVTEFTTEYATDNTRPTGTTTEGASANIYRTVATFAPNGGTTLAVTEHGIFSQAANSGGVLLDRSKFAAVNLVVANGDSIVGTYDFTITSGS